MSKQIYPRFGDVQRLIFDSYHLSNEILERGENF